jgi:hypothetical protein
MNARKGRLRDKRSSSIGKWLNRYTIKNTCRNWKRNNTNGLKKHGT